MSSHDHEIKIGTTTYQFDIARDENGKLQYQITEDVPQYQNSLEIVFNDWRGGSGQERYTGNNKYYHGVAVNGTEKGTIFSGIPNTAVTLYSASTQLVYSYDHGTTTYTDESTAAGNATANDMTLMQAAPEVNDAIYFGCVASAFNYIKLNIGTAGAGTWTITWEFWNGAAWADGSVTNNFTTAGENTINLVNFLTWASTTVNGTAAYWVRARVSAYTAITTQPKGTQSWLHKTGAMTDAPIKIIFSQYLSKTVVATPTKVYIGTSDTTFEERFAPGSGTINSIVEHNNILYIGMGASVLWYFSTDGLNFTQTDLSDAYANHFIVAPNPAGTQFVLYSAKNPNELRYTTDGRTVALGGQTLSSVAYIGDTSTDFTGGGVVGDKLLLGKEDGIYHYNSDGGVTNLSPELRFTPATNSFKYWAEYHGNIYTTIGNELFELTSYFTITKVDPVGLGDNLSIRGNVCGVIAARDFLYCMVDELTNVTIYQGQLLDNDNTVGWAWHPVGVIAGADSNVISAAPNSTSTLSFYLYYGVGNALQYSHVILRPLAVAVGSFYTTSSVTLPYIYPTNPNWDMIFTSCVTELIGVRAGSSITISYRKDAETSFTNCTSAITANGITETNLTAALTCARIQYKITWASSGVFRDVQLRYISFKGTEIPTTIRTHDVVYSLGTNYAQTTKTKRDFLNSARTATALTKLADLRWGQKTSGTASGDYVWVRMLPGYPKDMPIVDTKGKQIEIGMNCRWQEVSYTIS